MPDNAKILVVDDTATNQEILKWAFEKGGFQVIQAYDGMAALDMVKKERPALMMLDIMMPKMDGIDVLKRVKIMDPDLLVVMMTAHGSEQIAVEAMKLGADDYLTKPFHPKDVTALANKLIKERAVRLENLKLKEQIERAERYLAHLVDSVNEAIISTDLNGKILSFNKAAEGLWGMHSENIVGKGIEDLFFKGKNPHYVEKILEETKEKGTFEGEFLFLRVDGTTFPGHLNTSIVKAEETRRGFVAVVRDLTVERHLQQQLVESQKLASLGKVVEGVAHEVRNPLLSIGGFARRINKQTEEGAPTKKYLNAIIKDVERLEKMVNDIEGYVSFLKLNKLSYDALDITALFKNLLEEFKERMASAKVTASLNLSPSLPTIYANEVYIIEMFSCIIENAIEAMPDGGKIYITIKVENNYLVTEVADTGIGIPKGKEDEIFNPFFTSKMSGTGLGLTKCHMIVSDHKGYIRLNSTPGEGTVFTIGLPVERRQPVML
ncbi:MAG: sensor hybrid histidine kinase [Deltaproteobacteria bacterium]|nr:sensor hybrid histidine kinase [Deltaproteobacteria bacterium]